MFVITREQRQTLMIGDNVTVTVVQIRGQSTLIAASGIGPGQTQGPGTIRSWWLDRDQEIEVAPGVKCRVMDIRQGKARLGITVPIDVSVHRKEVYDAIQREKREARRIRPEDDDDWMSGSPVPR